MKKRFTVTLSEDVVKQAKKKAIDENTNFSAMVETLLVEHVSDETPYEENAVRSPANKEPIYV